MTPMKPHRSSAERGQILVLFALALVAIIGMVGLVLDGGSAFAQRRVEQNAADVAALAAAQRPHRQPGQRRLGRDRRNVASQNGYTNGVDGATVEVTCVNCPGQAVQTFDAAVPGVQVTVNITAPHRTTSPGSSACPPGTSAPRRRRRRAGRTPRTAQARSSCRRTHSTAGGDPIHCTGPIDECDLDHPVDDTPTQWSEFTWTDFGYDLGYDDPEEVCPPDGEPFELGNVNDSDLQNYMDGSADFSVTLDSAATSRSTTAAS